MTRGTKLFLVFSIVAFLGIFAYRFEQYLIEREYPIVVNVACEEEDESCFVADCSPDEDPDCDLTPYVKIEIAAAEAPGCLLEHTCESFSCDAYESCSPTFCSEESLEEGEVCLVEEEEVEIEEDVEEESADEAIPYAS